MAGLKPPDMDDCSEKCMCGGGENAGSIYGCDQPCSDGTDFNEQKCECETAPGNGTWVFRGKQENSNSVGTSPDSWLDDGRYELCGYPSIMKTASVSDAELEAGGYIYSPFSDSRDCGIGKATPPGGASIDCKSDTNCTGEGFACGLSLVMPEGSEFESRQLVRSAYWLCDQNTEGTIFDPEIVTRPGSCVGCSLKGEWVYVPAEPPEEGGDGD